MANTDNPNGFRPIFTAGVRPPTRYPIEASYATDLYIGDMVALSSGFIVESTAGTDNQLLGAIVGFECAGGFNKDYAYYPASSALDWYAIVADDPHQLFVAQCDGGGTLAEANIGETLNIKQTHSGNTTTGLSGMEIDSSATNGAVTDQLRLVGLLDNPGNAWGANGEYIVTIHNHQFRQENNVDATST